MQEFNEMHGADEEEFSLYNFTAVPFHIDMYGIKMSFISRKKHEQIDK